jgi:hypothetical protein
VILSRTFCWRFWIASHLRYIPLNIGYSNFEVLNSFTNTYCKVLYKMSTCNKSEWKKDRKYRNISSFNNRASPTDSLIEMSSQPFSPSSQPCFESSTAFPQTSGQCGHRQFITNLNA